MHLQVKSTVLDDCRGIVGGYNVECAMRNLFEAQVELSTALAYLDLSNNSSGFVHLAYGMPNAKARKLAEVGKRFYLNSIESNDLVISSKLNSFFDSIFPIDLYPLCELTDDEIIEGLEDGYLTPFSTAKGIAKYAEMVLDDNCQ